MSVKDQLMKSDDAAVSMAREHMILMVKSGSHLYGLNTALSDEDYVGIFIPTPEHVLGIKTCRQVDASLKDKLANNKNSKDAIDITLYSLQEFIKLASANNPNIIELLYAPDEAIVHITKLGRELLDNKHLFLSGEALTRFNGYAMTQRGKNFTKISTYELLLSFRNYIEHDVLNGRSKENFKEYYETLPDEIKSMLKNTDDKFVWRLGDLKFNNGIMLKEVLKLVYARINAATNRLDDMIANGYDGKALSHLLRLQVEMIQLVKYRELRFPLTDEDYKTDIIDTKYGNKEIHDILKLSDKLDEIIKENEGNFRDLKNKPNKLNDLCVSLTQKAWINTYRPLLKADIGEHLIGINYDENKHKLAELDHRVVSKGIESYIITDDFNPERFNLKLDENSIITTVTWG